VMCVVHIGERVSARVRCFTLSSRRGDNPAC
jgi:hypothetical protein